MQGWGWGDVVSFRRPSNDQGLGVSLEGTSHPHHFIDGQLAISWGRVHMRLTTTSTPLQGASSLGACLPVVQWGCNTTDHRGSFHVPGTQQKFGEWWPWLLICREKRWHLRAQGFVRGVCSVSHPASIYWRSTVCQALARHTFSLFWSNSDLILLPS